MDLERGSTVSAGADSSNAGLIDLRNTSKLTVIGNFTNTGTVESTLDATPGNSVTVTGTLTNQAGAKIEMEVFDLVTAGELDNYGTFILHEDGFLELTNGITSIAAGSVFVDDAAFVLGAGFKQLTSVEGFLTLTGFQSSANVTPNGGVFKVSNAGSLDMEFGSVLTINGNFNNLGQVTTDFHEQGGLNMLTISGDLINSGSFSLNGGGDVVNVGTLTNTGKVYVGSGAVLYLNNQPGGITDIVAGSTFDIAGTFCVDMCAPDNKIDALANLNSVEGTLTLETGQITPFLFSLTINSGGTLNLANGTTLNTSSFTNSGSIQVNGGSDLGNGGDLTNAVGGTITMGSLSGGNHLDADTLENYGNIMVNGFGDSVTGDLHNGDDTHTAASFSLNGLHSTANLVGLTNHGSVLVKSGSVPGIPSLYVGDVSNYGTISTQLSDDGSPNVITIGGTLTNSGTFQLNGPGDMASIGNGLTNSGAFGIGGGSTVNITGDVDNRSGFFGAFLISGGSTANITGDVDNEGRLETGGFSGPGNNKLTISGTLTNEANKPFGIDNSGDSGSIGKLVNDGLLYVGPGATLNLTHQPDGITDVAGGSVYEIGGTFTAGANNAFYKLGTVEGALELVNGQVTNVTPGGGVLNISTNVSGTGQIYAMDSSTLNVGGDLNVGAGGTRGLLVVNSGGTVAAQKITIETLGEIDAKGGTLTYTSLLNMGTLDPVGIANLIGNSLTVFPQGRILLDIIGAGNGQYGQLDITGSALLQGLTVLDFMNGFAPKKGDVFDLINITGTFDYSKNTIDIEGLQPGFDYSLDFANGEFTLTAVNDGIPAPEPATLLVLIPGLLGVGYGLRRKLLQ